MTVLATTPAEAISSYMKEHGWTQQELADKLEVSRQTANYLINGRNSLTGKMMLRLAKLTDLPVEYWHELQAQQNASTSETSSGTPQKSFSRPFPGKLIDREIRTALSTGDLVIDGFDPDNLGSTFYTLHVGQNILGSDDSLQTQDFSTLREKVLYTIETLESIQLPDQMEARIELLTDLGSEGLILNGGSTIEAGHEGSIEVPLLKIFGDETQLATKDPLCRISFFWLPEVPARVLQRRKLQAIDSKILDLSKEQAALLKERQEINNLDL